MTPTPSALGPLEHVFVLLDDINSMNQHFINRVSDYLGNATNIQLAQKYDAWVKAGKVDLGFNLFELISDVYHRENLHSDIMAAFLSPTGSHGHGDLFLRLFLEFIKQHHSVDVNLEDYANARVVREAAKIDILICDDQSRRAIVIENKMNGAADMERQLVRYHARVTGGWNYTCDAILYIGLNLKRTPDKTGWQEEETQKVMHLLRAVSAYDEHHLASDLYHGWLLRCHDACTHDDVRHVIRQYSQLIFKIGRYSMNKPLMLEFYTKMLDQERHQSALFLTAMLNDMPAFRSLRVYEAFLNDTAPFAKLWAWTPSIAVFEKFAEGNIKIHVDSTHQELTTVSFWNCTNDDPDGSVPRRILKQAGMLDEFIQQGNGWFTRTFTFPTQESELIPFLQKFKSALIKRTAAVAT